MHGCACGYRVSSVNGTQLVFTESLETDFTHLGHIGTDNPCWQPQAYQINASVARGDFGKYATVQNIIPNPFAFASQWDGFGIHGGDAGLQLWVNSSLIDNMIPMAEMVARRHDMMHGSFRIGMKVTNVPGTCGAFFWVSRATS